MKTVADFDVKLTNSQRKAINASRTMRNFRTGLKSGESLEFITADRLAISADRVHIQTNTNVYQLDVTPRGRIIAERTCKR